MISIAPDVWTVDRWVKLRGGLQFPVRMTVIRLADGRLWLHSPIELDDELDAELAALGEVAHLVAPNHQHFLYAAAARARELLVRLGLENRMAHRPAELSGGEQQRVAIARAIANRPLLLLADEPTGNLDSSSGQSVLEMLTQAARAGTAVIMVTHSQAHAAVADRMLKMLDGQVVSETRLGT